MANSINSIDTIVEQVLRESIPIQSPAIPSCLSYCTPIKLAGPVVAGKVNIPVVTVVQAVQTNPTTFENSGDTLTNIQEALVTYSAQFGFNNTDQIKGLDLSMLLASHVTKIQQSIQAAINAVITTGNFAAATVTVSSANWGQDDCETLLESVPARSTLTLLPGYFVKTKSTWMPAGKENLLTELSHTTGLPANTAGFVARPEAIALPYGYPLAGPGNDIRTSTIKLPIGLDIQFSRWYQRGGREWRGSLDICLCAEVGQAGALRILKSA